MACLNVQMSKGELRVVLSHYAKYKQEAAGILVSAVHNQRNCTRAGSQSALDNAMSKRSAFK